MNEGSKSIRVSIFGRDYSVKGGSDEEYIRTLAAHVDSVMRDIADKTGSLSSGRVAILAALNIADELHKERRRFGELASELAQELEEALGMG
jgi:cell division protein ZapA